MIQDMQTSAMSLWYHLTNSKQEVIIVTDGSCKNHKASYAWIMHDGLQQITTGSGMVSGNPTTAFRSELFGIAAWYCCVYHATHYLHHDQHFTIVPYTDNTKVIQYHQQVLSQEAELTAFMDDYDLYIMIQKYHHQLTTNGVVIKALQKVQSTKTSKTHQSIPEQLHHSVDDMARLKHLNTDNQNMVSIPEQYTHLSDVDGAIASSEKQIIIQH